MSWLFKPFQAIGDGDHISAESQSNSVDSTATDSSLKYSETLAVVAAGDSFDSSSSSSSRSRVLRGIRNDLAEISGGFRTGFSILSVNSKKAVGEISRFASNLLQFQRCRSVGDEDYEELEDEFIDDAPGITNEFLDFVAEISLRPEYWTEFPLALGDSDFKMSYVQRMHTSTVEQLIPNISALKAQLRCFMSNELFWLVYFVLVLPGFNQHDFELLATREIVKTRNQVLEIIDNLEKAKATRITGGGGEGLEIQDGDEENTNQWLKMEDSERCTEAAKERDGGLEEGNPPFSDIEEDDWTNLSGRFFGTNPPRTSSSTESSDWVKLHENHLDSKLDQPKTNRDSEAEGLSDWSNMDGFD